MRCISRVNIPGIQFAPMTLSNLVTQTIQEMHMSKKQDFLRDMQSREKE